MKRTFLIRLVYVDRTGARPNEEEVVLVDAETVEQAARMAMKRNKIRAGGRLVEKYDEAGIQIHA